MNSKRHNAFSDIPGFDASKGERIVKALQKLWKKIEYLEQVRTSERTSRVVFQNSKESDNNDLTVTDIQYKLLVLQLQYVRSILRKKLTQVSASGVQMRPEKRNSPAFDKSDVRKGDEVHNDSRKESVSQETQVQSDSDGELNSVRDFGLGNKDKTYPQVPPSDDHSTRPKYLDENSTSVTQRIFPSNSKPHYHLKLDDVPFILGASATASHSIVANVQSIIAKMKQHNRALCGPNTQTGRSAGNPLPTSSAVTHSSEDYSKDATKMLNELSRDLCELALRQQKLVKSIDAAQEKNEFTNSVKNYERENKKSAENQRSKSVGCSTEYESKLHAAVRSSSQPKEKKIKKCDVPPKQTAINIRSQPSNLSILSRRNLLRSLQNFKTHLSEEDISWD